MKIPAIILNTLILISFISCSLDLEKLSEEDVNQEQLDHAEQFANKYLITLKKGSTYEFKDEAIDALKDKLTPEKQKAVHSQLKENLGDFKSLVYVETYTTGDKKLNIYRFNGDFSESTDKIEIRVVINDANKIAGFWIRPWVDTLN